MKRRERKRITIVAVGLIAILGASALFAEYYQLRGVRRVEKDLYKTIDNVYIETKYCYHYTYGEDAILKWEGRYGDNKIIWDDDSSCQVESVWRK